MGVGGRGSYSPTTGRPRPCRDVRVDRDHLLPVVVRGLLVVLVVLGLVVAWCLLSRPVRVRGCCAETRRAR